MALKLNIQPKKKHLDGTEFKIIYDIFYHAPYKPKTLQDVYVVGIQNK
jgi:hypothetical protein